MNNMNMRRVLKQPTLRMREGGQQLTPPAPAPAMDSVSIAQRIQAGLDSERALRNAQTSASSITKDTSQQQGAATVARMTRNPALAGPGQPAPWAQASRLRFAGQGAQPMSASNIMERANAANLSAPSTEPQPSLLPASATGITSAPYQTAAATPGGPAPIPGASPAVSGAYPEIAGNNHPAQVGPAPIPTGYKPTGLKDVYSDGKSSFGNQAGLANKYTGPTAGGTPGHPTDENMALMDRVASRSGQAPAGWQGQNLDFAHPSPAMNHYQSSSPEMNHYQSSSAPAIPGQMQHEIDQSSLSPSAGFGRPVGLRDGGNLRTGHGGQVPGHGHGDKIPAKYEPGEFVVSNDMLEAKPSLRGELQVLRKHVLAKKGMTPAMADAKAVSNPKGLRASDAVILGADGRPLPTPAAPPTLAFETPEQMAQRLIPQVNQGEFPTTGAARAPQPSLTSVEPTAAPEAPQKLKVVRAVNPRTGAYVGGSPPPPSSGGATAAVPPEAPRGSLYKAGNRAGNLAGQAAEFANRPMVKSGARFLMTGVGGVNALHNAYDTEKAIDSGNTAGAIDSGAQTVASLAGIGPGVMGTTSAGALGAAYLGGHMVGTHWYNNMDPAVQHALGRDINSGVRKVGNFFGQDWGVDDSALRASRGEALEPGVNANAPAPAAVAKPTQPIAGDATMPDNEPQGRVEAAAAANPNPGGGMGGANVAARDNALANSLRDSRMSQDTAGYAQQDAQQQVNQMLGDKVDQERALRDAQTSASSIVGSKAEKAARRANLTQVMGQGQNLTNQTAETARTNLTNKAKMLSDQMHNRTALRGQDITSADSRYGHELTANTARSRLAYDDGWKRAEFGQTNDKQDFDFKNTAQKNVTDQIAGMLPAGADGKPDTTTAARYSAGLNAMVANRQAALTQHLQQHPEDAQAASELAGIKRQGLATVGADYVRRHTAGMQLADIANGTATGGFTPWGTKAVVSAAPITRLTKVASNSGVGHDYITDRGTRENPEVIPARYVDKEGGMFGIGGRANVNFDILKGQ